MPPPVDRPVEQRCHGCNGNGYQINKATEDGYGLPDVKLTCDLCDGTGWPAGDQPEQRCPECNGERDRCEKGGHSHPWGKDAPFTQGSPPGGANPYCCFNDFHSKTTRVEECPACGFGPCVTPDDCRELDLESGPTTGGEEMRSLLPAFREMGVGTTKLEAALLDSEQRCTCEPTGECTYSMSGPTCRVGGCPPCQHPDLERDPDCPVHPEIRADTPETGELGEAIKVARQLVAEGGAKLHGERLITQKSADALTLLANAAEQNVEDRTLGRDREYLRQLIENDLEQLDRDLDDEIVECAERCLRVLSEAGPTPGPLEGSVEAARELYEMLARILSGSSNGPMKPELNRQEAEANRAKARDLLDKYREVYG